MRKALTSICFGLPFKDVYMVLEDKDHVFFPPSKGQACLLPIVKDSGTLHSGFISFNYTHSMYRYHLSLSVALCKTGRKTLILQIFIAINTMSFVSKPGDQRLLPASQKLKQVNNSLHVRLCLRPSSVFNTYVIHQFYSQFFFQKLLYCSLQWLYQFTFPPIVQKCSLFLHTLFSIYCLQIF